MTEPHVPSGGPVERPGPEDPWPEPPAKPRGRRGAGPLVRQGLLVVLVFAVVGAAAGVVWYLLWTPPTGVVVGHAWYPDETGLRRDFAGTGWYVTVAAVVGLCLGIVVAWLFDRSELVTLLAVCIGSVVAAWLMYEVGSHLGPGDPVALARHTNDNQHLKGDLRVHGTTPWLALPAGALVGLAAVYFSTQGRDVENSG